MTSFLNNICITASQEQPVLSKAQKTFNNLIGKIEKKRAELQAWEVAMPHYQKRYTDELLPLVETSLDLQAEFLIRLDQISGQKGLSKIEIRKITHFVCDLACSLLKDRDDEQFKAIYNKHSGGDYDSEEADEIEGAKSMMEQMFGIDMNGIDLKASPDEMAKQLHEKMEALRAKYDAEHQSRTERKAKQKKSAKQIAKEQAQQAEEQKISQSIREVYRKLASALHPDRETDPSERERKTALIQRVNQAYDKKNLLELLELQLEIEHIDLASMKNISQERLTGYNKILKEQLRELEEEIFHVENDFKMRCRISPFEQLNPATLSNSINRNIADIRKTIKEIEKDMSAIQDIKTTKSWLKKMGRKSDKRDFDEIDFFDDMSFFDDRF